MDLPSPTASGFDDKERAPRFGARLRYRREELGRGLRETAMRVGVSPTYLSRIETDAEKSSSSTAASFAIPGSVGGLFYELMPLAGRIPSDLLAYIIEVVDSLLAELAFR
jgi:transcriptional regulator with XRE-family HTH domain